MKKFLTSLRDVAVAGFFFMFPVYVFLLIVTKAWTLLLSVGSGVAGLFGVKSILGVGGSSVFSGLLLIVTWLTCGLLVRFSFVRTLNRAVERWLSKYIPGYDAYKAMAEENLNRKVKPLPYTSALIKQQECWQPAYVVEQDDAGNYVVFIPGTPETNKGHIFLARTDQVKTVPSVTAKQLDALLKKLGKGLLSQLADREESSARA